MTGMMLTAFDSASDTILDITAMTIEQRDKVHGRRTARSNGYDIVCRDCHRPVHVVLYPAHKTVFWRHDPGEAVACIRLGVAGGESPEHFEAKVTIIGALRQLTGWTAVPERRFYFDDGGHVEIDVYAEHSNPAPHQSPVAWEVQLGHQTHGRFTERTEGIRRAAGVTASWITPWDAALDGHQGIVTDPTAQLVVGRLYTAPDESAPPLPPMPLPTFVKAVSARHPKLLWSASGEDNRFIAYPRDSVGNTPKRTPTPILGTPPEIEDRACERPPIQPRPLVRRDSPNDGFAIHRGHEAWTFNDFKDAATICRDLTIGRQRKCTDCDEPTNDISGLCRKCINDRLQRRLENRPQR